MSTQFLEKLSQNYIEALKAKEYCDINLEVGKGREEKIFRAHKIVLSYRSPYLRQTLASNENNSDGTLPCIKLTNISSEIFHIILEYIYGGTLSLNNIDTSDILKILDASDHLCLKELIDYLQSYLIENKADWMEQHFELTYQTSFRSNNLIQLQDYLMEKYPEKAFKSLDFTSFPEKHLITLLGKDDLQMKEIEIWEHLLKWGLAQNPTLSSDPAIWTDDDFKAVEKTLKSCLPLIRFYVLSSKDFLQKVHPYKKLLKPQLYEDLLKYYLDPEDGPSDKNILPPRYEKCDSKIVNLNIFSLVSKWINKVDISSKFAHRSELYLPYKFNLLLRGSRDGFSPNVFHSHCDNKPKTVTFVKVKGTEEILGGYNPIIWKTTSRSWNACEDSFIFSFKIKKYVFKDAIRSNIKKTEHALYYDKCFGPSFGSDLVLSIDQDNCNDNYNDNHCKLNYYEKGIREDIEDDFVIEDYEVFQIEDKNLATTSSNVTLDENLATASSNVASSNVILDDDLVTTTSNIETTPPSVEWDETHQKGWADETPTTWNETPETINDPRWDETHETHETLITSERDEVSPDWDGSLITSERDDILSEWNETNETLITSEQDDPITTSERSKVLSGWGEPFTSERDDPITTSERNEERSTWDETLNTSDERDETIITSTWDLNTSERDEAIITSEHDGIPSGRDKTPETANASGWDKPLASGWDDASETANISGWDDAPETVETTDSSRQDEIPVAPIRWNIIPIG